MPHAQMLQRRRPASCVVVFGRLALIVLVSFCWITIDRTQRRKRKQSLKEGVVLTNPPVCRRPFPFSDQSHRITNLTSSPAVFKKKRSTRKSESPGLSSCLDVVVKRNSAAPSSNRSALLLSSHNVRGTACRHPSQLARICGPHIRTSKTRTWRNSSCRQG